MRSKRAGSDDIGCLLVNGLIAILIAGAIYLFSTTAIWSKMRDNIMSNIYGQTFKNEYFSGIFYLDSVATDEYFFKGITNNKTATMTITMIHVDIETKFTHNGIVGTYSRQFLIPCMVKPKSKVSISERLFSINEIRKSMNLVPEDSLIFSLDKIRLSWVH